MSTTKVNVRAAAEQIRDMVAKKYAAYLEPIVSERTGKVIVPAYDGPQVVVWDDGTVLVSWEDGPSDWAYTVSGGGVNEEEAALLADANREFGSNLRPANHTPFVWPKGIYAEPYYSFALAVYAD